ncbi:MAG TPA: hypothetical protein PLL20_20255 [Phycisphaerae bacterium]|nr:hypothetical protein [Phycisphaerae bacterium]HRR86630.1 hypothetical protein [Phycisphaerae bacterium]
MRRTTIFGCVLTVVLLIPATVWADAPPGTIVYIEDEFLPDQDMNGWTTYGDRTMSNPAGNGFSLFNPTYRTDDVDGIAGIQEGHWGGRSFGMYKRFYDEYVPNGEKHIQAWVKMMSCDWNWNQTPNALTVRLGKDPLGGTDPNAPSVIWTEPYWGDWNRLELIQPCVEGWETIFIQVNGSFSGYYAIYVDTVEVCQRRSESAEISPV